MAIDTAMKRFSMLNFATQHCYARLIQPDGSIDGDDRAFFLHLYGGNALDGASEASSGTRRIRHIAAIMKARARRAR